MKIVRIEKSEWIHSQSNFNSRIKYPNDRSRFSAGCKPHWLRLYHWIELLDLKNQYLSARCKSSFVNIDLLIVFSEESDIRNSIVIFILLRIDFFYYFFHYTVFIKCIYFEIKCQSLTFREYYFTQWWLINM